MQQRSLPSSLSIYDDPAKKFLDYTREFLSIYVSNKNAYGLTLIEILITISVLSLCLLTLANMQVVAFQVSNHSSKLMQATTITQDTIEALMAIDFDDPSLSDLTPPGVFTTYTLSQATLNFAPPAGINVRWDVDSNADGTRSVNITTTWQSSGELKSLSLPLRRTTFQ